MNTRAPWTLGVKPKFEGGHSIELLRGGDDLFPAMGTAIAQARHTIWLATYIFHDDAVAQTLALLLAEAARRGVQVRVVVDGFGSKATLAALREWMVPAGVELAVFRPIDRWWSYLQPGQARRLHQKLCVVDGGVAFVGGINLIADRNDLHHGWSDAPRLDFACRIRGVAVDHAQLLVQPARLARLQVAPPAIDRTEHRQLHARGHHPLAQGRQRRLRAEAVHHHAHLHATARGVGQQQRERLRDGVVVEDVGGQPDRVARLCDRRPHRREQRIAAAQQLDRMAALELRLDAEVPGRARVDALTTLGANRGTPSGGSIGRRTWRQPSI